MSDSNHTLVLPGESAESNDAFSDGKNFGVSPLNQRVRLNQKENKRQNLNIEDPYNQISSAKIKQSKTSNHRSNTSSIKFDRKQSELQPKTSSLESTKQIKGNTKKESSIKIMKETLSNQFDISKELEESYELGVAPSEMEAIQSIEMATQKLIDNPANSINQTNVIVKDQGYNPEEFIQDAKLQQAKNQRRSIVHNFALDQNFDILFMILSRIKKSNIQNANKILEDIVNLRDNYGNNSLILACVHDAETKKEEKLKCIEFLIKECQADPNVRNLHTGFTPLHWAARHGEIKIVKLLCEVGGAHEFIPDMMGYTPIDYAGFFQHHQTLKYLIERLIPKMISHRQYMSTKTVKDFNERKKKTRSPPKPGSKQVVQGAVLKVLRESNVDLEDSGGNLQNYNDASDEACFDHEEDKEEGKRRQPHIFKCKNLLLSPDLRSHILYWACTLNEEQFHWSEVRRLLQEIEAFPEFPNKMQNGKTALHAAAMTGNWKKLKILLMNMTRRYVNRKKNLTKSSEFVSVVEEDLGWDPYPHLPKLVFTHLIQQAYLISVKQLRLKQLAKNFKHFERHYLRLHQNAEEFIFSFDIQEKDGLTPLHLACQFAHTECAHLLLLEYGASADISNESGIRPRDMIHNENIKFIFQKFYDKIDKAVQDSASLDKEGSKFEHIAKMVTQAQFEKEENENDVNLSDNEQKTTKQQLARIHELSNQICFKNMFSFYSTKVPPHVLLQMRNIVENRNWLPEICHFTMQVQFKNTREKNLLNKTIQTLIQSKFVVKMFPAAESPEKQFFLIIELEQEDLEREAEAQEYLMKLMESPLKYKFHRKQRNLYEPFRSKDIQEITFNIIRKVLDLPELQRKGIILQINRVHDWYAIADIEQKFKDTKILQFFKQYFIDNRPQQYFAITAIKNYFGERWGFQYAFMDFYTTWLFVPSFFGFLVTIKMYTTKQDFSLWNFWYSILVSIWITFFEEFWKRKQNELRLIWGTLQQEQDNNDEGQLHVSFKGNEEFSYWNYKVTLKNVSSVGIIYRIMNFFVSVFFIFFALTSFFTTKIYFGTFSGVLNGVIFFVTNTAYKKVAFPLNVLENHKYDRKFQEAFISKLFWFQFINAHASILYSIYNELHNAREDQREQVMDNLNTLILGVVLTKTSTFFVTKIFFRVFTGNVKKAIYFKKCKDHATVQMENHHKLLSDPNFDKEMKQQIRNFNDDKKRMEINAHLLDHKGKNYEYKRLITVFQRDEENKQIIDDEPLIVDQIEVNSRLVDLTIENELQELSDIYILFSYAVLYCFICPILPGIIFVFNLMSRRWNRHVHFHYMKRQPLIEQNGLGPWQNVLTYLSYATVLMNMLMMYWFRMQIVVQIENLIIDLQFLFPKSISYNYYNNAELLGPSTSDEARLTDKDMLDFVLVILFTEHIIVLLKYFLAEFINDEPSWVVKKMIEVNSKIEELNRSSKQQAQEDTERSLRLAIQQQKTSFTRLIEKISNKYATIVQEMQMLQEKFQELKAKSAMQTPSGKMDRRKSILGNTQPNFGQHIKKDQLKPTLSSFLTDRFQLDLNQRQQSTLEQRLNEQIQNRLFRETFHFIERHVLQKRLVKITNSDMAIKINCAECSKRQAILQCSSCDNDFYCQACYDEIHPITNVQLRCHQVTRLKSRADSTKNSSNFFNNEAFLSKFDSGQMARWQKYEKFNFPLSEESEYFNQVRLYFRYAKETFVKINNISDVNRKADIVKMMLDQNYKLIDQERDKTFSAMMFVKFNEERKNAAPEDLCAINDFELVEFDSQKKVLDWEKTKGSKGGQNNSGLLHGKGMFNDEDLLWLNRVAFRLLCKFGPNLQFKTFIGSLKVLQEGALIEKIELIVDMFKEGREQSNVVQLDNLIHFILVSMPQDTQFEFRAENELINLFNDLDEQNHELVYQRYFTIDEIKSKLQKFDPVIHDILRCVLQC